MTDVKTLDNVVRMRISNCHSLVSEKKGKIKHVNKKVTLEAIIVQDLTCNLLPVKKNK